jgi:hypothetical protein
MLLKKYNNRRKYFSTFFEKTFHNLDIRIEKKIELKPEYMGYFIYTLAVNKTYEVVPKNYQSHSR